LAEAFRTRYFGFRVKHFREQIVRQAMLRQLVHATPTMGLSRVGHNLGLHEEVEKAADPGSGREAGPGRKLLTASAIQVAAPD
jgi:hypothetical protein